MAAIPKKPSPKPAARRAKPSKGPAELPDQARERIAMKAYELWGQRGQRHGQAMQDWIEAETIVTQDLHEARP